MSDPQTLCVYQFKVVLRGISPMIWRRLLLRSDHSIADLHYALQIAMGWSDAHLNRFHLHGKDYGVAPWSGSKLTGRCGPTGWTGAPSIAASTNTRVASGPGSSVTPLGHEIPHPPGRRIRSGSTRAGDRLFGAQRASPGDYRPVPSGGQ